jgi:predicted transport protein
MKELLNSIKEMVLKQNELIVFKERKIDIAIKLKYNFAFIHLNGDHIFIDILYKYQNLKDVIKNYDISEKKELKRKFMSSGSRIIIRDDKHLDEIVLALILASKIANAA